jgi:hypothetical protein
MMMSSTVLVHTKGFGSSFQCDAHTSIAASSSRVELKLALVNALRVSTENHPSIRFSHDADVGREVQVPSAPFRVGEPAADRFGLVSGQVVQHDMHVEIGGHVEIDPLEEREHVSAGVASAGVVQHLAGGDVHRREKSTVPLRS